jgi:hypothetical protein
MQCIFCKTDSTASKTIEHIIPESLGNVEHTLPRGAVCDACNNYFARKIEKPLLDGAYFKLSRFRNSVVNKKGRIPTAKGIHLQSRTIIEVCKSDEGISVYPTLEKDNDKFARSILTKKTGSLILPVAPEQESDKRLMSRFVGKIAIEALAQRLMPIEGGQEEIVDKEELDELRDYVRWNKGKFDWQFYTRKIYDEDFIFTENDSEYEVLHEYTFLYTVAKELYFAIAIWGIEYVINMGGPEIEGYTQWLNLNENKSPLM